MKITNLHKLISSFLQFYLAYLSKWLLILKFVVQFGCEDTEDWLCLLD